jgi:CheY-like chemotaxis protein
MYPLRILLVESDPVREILIRQTFQEDFVTVRDSIDSILNLDMNLFDLIILNNEVQGIECLKWVIAVHQLHYKYLPVMFISKDELKCNLTSNFINVFSCKQDEALYFELWNLYRLIFSTKIEVNA